MGAADEGFSRHAENAEHSPAARSKGREQGQGSAPAGDPDPAVPGRRNGAGQGTALCFLAPAGEDGNPALCAVGWDSTASVPQPPRSGGDLESHGHGEGVPNDGGPLSSGSMQVFPAMEKHVAEQDHAQPQPGPSPPSRRAPSPWAPPAATAGAVRCPPAPHHHPPPGSLPAFPWLLAAMHLEVVCLTLLRPLRALLPAPSWDKMLQTRCRNPLPPGTEPSCAGSPHAVPLCSQPPSSLSPCHFPTGRGTTPAKPQPAGNAALATPRKAPADPSILMPCHIPASRIAPGWQGCNSSLKTAAGSGGGKGRQGEGARDPTCVTGDTGEGPVEVLARGEHRPPPQCPQPGSTHPCPGRGGGEETSGRAARLSNAGAGPKHLDFPGNWGRERGDQIPGGTGGGGTGQGLAEGSCGQTGSVGGCVWGLSLMPSVPGSSSPSLSPLLHPGQIPRQ